MPCVLKMLSHVNVSCKLTCSCANVPRVLTCFCVKCLRAFVLKGLRAWVLASLVCQRTLRAYMLTWQRALRAYVHMCQRTSRVNTSVCLCTRVSKWFASSSGHVSTCFEPLASQGLCDHTITCQHALPPQ